MQEGYVDIIALKQGRKVPLQLQEASIREPRGVDRDIHIAQWPVPMRYQ